MLACTAYADPLALQLACVCGRGPPSARSRYQGERIFSRGGGAVAPDTCTDRITSRFVKDRYRWSTSDVFVNSSLCRCFFYRKNRRRIYREDHDGRLPARGGVQHVHRENRKTTLLMNSSSTDLEGAGWFQSGVRLI